jgi:hypothetical protein
MIVDEVSVLRDAHMLDEQGLDLCPEPGEPDYDIARKLCDAGYLQISIVGEILGAACYRLTPKGRPLAAECHSVIQSERALLLQRLADAITAALGP